MIIFYNKNTGKIIGAIEGRVHPKDNKVWIGSRDINDRLMINWKKNEEGTYMPDVKDNEQKALFIAIDKKSTLLYDFKIDLKSKFLIHKNVSGKD